MTREQILDQLRGQIASIEEGSSEAHFSADLSEKNSESPEGAGANSRPRKNYLDEEGGDDASKALKKIVDLVNVSDRSEKTIRERLHRYDFSEEGIDEAVEKAKGYGFIDDARFAEILIRSRVSQGKGSTGIERELVSNGIDPSSVEGWPYEFDVGYDAEWERALSLLDRKPPRSKNLREGAFRRLVQKGFPVAVASSVARAWSEGRSLE